MHKSDKVEKFDASQFEGGETDEESPKKRNRSHKDDAAKVTKFRLFIHGLKNQHRLFSLVFLFN